MMKNTYEKPTLAKVGALPLVTAAGDHLKCYSYLPCE
jgi:hypothetical protein